LTDLNPKLSTIHWGAQEPLSWTGSDGLGLDGLLVLPAGRTRNDGPFPLVTIVHGGPYESFRKQLQLESYYPAQWLTHAGYAVLLPNPRGGWGHGHDFAMSILGRYGGSDWDDIVAGIDALIEERVADPDRLGIAGWSGGGFMTAWAVTQTNRFKAAVMGAGICDWGMMAAESDLFHFQARLGGHTDWDTSAPSTNEVHNPISHAHRVTTPVLIVHGERDDRVPPSQSRYFARALREFGVPHELVIYPREPHIFEERQHMIDLHHRIRGWFERWLGPADESRHRPST
jgi:dipeptidyl aminopeptidase/acylaminoacyl peptidase